MLSDDSLDTFIDEVMAYSSEVMIFKPLRSIEMTLPQDPLRFF